MRVLPLRNNQLLNNKKGKKYYLVKTNAFFASCILKKQVYKVPLRACSASIDSNKALKLPLPND